MRLSSSLTSANHSACGPFQCSFIGKFEHILTPCVHSLFSLSLCRSMTAKNTKNTTFLFSFYVFFAFVSPFLFHFCFSQTGIGQGTSNLFLRQAEPQWVLAGLKGFLPSLRLFQLPLPFGWGRKDVSSWAEAYSFVGCRRLTHCRSFGNKSGWLYSLGPGCFSHQRAGNSQIRPHFYSH